MEKDGRKHVIRISQPGYETHWFSADSQERAEKWVEVSYTYKKTICVYCRFHVDKFKRGLNF